MKRFAITILFALISTFMLNAQMVSVQNGLYVSANGEMFTGKFTERFASGVMKSEITISNGKVDGLAIYFYENGAKMESGNYTSGLRVGLWEKWSEKGQQIGIANYKSGMKQGVWMVWDDQGRKRMEMHYLNGEKSGKWMMWDENGTLSGERLYSLVQ